MVKYLVAFGVPLLVLAMAMPLLRGKAGGSVLNRAAGGFLAAGALLALGLNLALWWTVPDWASNWVAWWLTSGTTASLVLGVVAVFVFLWRL